MKCLNKQCKFFLCGIRNNHILNFTALGTLFLTERLSQQGKDDSGHELDLLHCDFRRQYGRGIQRS